MTDTNNTQKSSEEVERDVRAARADLAGSINDLEARLSPNALFEQGLAYLRGPDGRRRADMLVRKAGANPLPLVLIGIGLAWLAMGSQPGPRTGTVGRQSPGDRRYAHDDVTEPGWGSSTTSTRTGPREGFGAELDNPASTGAGTGGRAVAQGRSTDAEVFQAAAPTLDPKSATDPSTRTGTTGDRDPITTAYTSQDASSKT